MTQKKVLVSAWTLHLKVCLYVSGERYKSTRITTHYSSAELINLWKAINKVSNNQSGPTLTLLKHKGHEKLTKPVLKIVGGRF